MRSLKRLMKSDREVREICKRETDAYLRENYEQIAKQAAYQTLAVAFVVLHRYFGFGGILGVLIMALIAGGNKGDD